tara:strand:- start:20453 stop:21055 length:603 start_codon:yes stop_codon:yes gene_type:complete
VFRSRLTRTVVNLSLIVAMMVQPGMALVFASGCGAECGASFMCEGCGCCEVSSPTVKCCCCGGGEQDGDGSCCMSESEPVEHDWNNEEWTEDEMMAEDLSASETLELQVIVISMTDADAVDESQTREVTGVCHCGMESQPLGDSSPSRPTIERRDSVAIRFADLATIFGDAIAKPSRLSQSEVSNSPAHFSQIHLCIWRL